jgi:hypothetical protein
MTTLAEIESAAATLPRSQQKLLLERLAANLRLAASSRTKACDVSASESVLWPDYEGRLREIYGDKPMPSMVLAERETESW